MSMVETTMDKTWSSWEILLGLGRMKMDFGDVLTMSWGSSTYSSSAKNAARKEIEFWVSSMVEVEEGAWGSVSSNSGDVEGVEVMQQVAGVLQ